MSEVESGEVADGEVTPVENTEVTETEVTTSEPAGEQVENTGELPTNSQADEDSERKSKPGAEKRISELVWQREEEKRRADYWEEQAKAGKTQETTQSPTEPQTLEELGPPPKLSDFDYDEDQHLAALTEWQDKRSEIREVAKSQEREKQTKLEQAQQEYTNSFNNAFETGKQKYEDFEQVVMGPGEQLKPDLLPSVVFAENAHEVAYHLGKHRDFVDKLNKMPPMRAILEIGRLSERLSDKPSTKVTNAPNPITTVSGEEPHNKNLENLSMEDYRKERMGR